MKVVTAAGATIDLGTTETTPTISITDYSRRVTDDFGVTTVVERGFARRLSVRLAVPFDGVDALQRRLADLRATAATWVADDRFAWLSAKGFYRDFELDLAVPPISFCTLTVEGFAETEVGADPGGDPAPVGLQSTLQLLQPITVTDAALLTSSVAENDAPAWAAASTYAKGARVMRDHQVYESLIAGNVGAEPAKSPAAWLTVGPTNRWAMFDDALGTATEGDRRIEVTVSAGRFNAIALLDVTGATVRVRTTGYDRMQAVSAGATTFLDMPAGDAQVTVTIAGPGAVSVGTLLIGTVVRLGATEAAPTAGITDYSRKEVDDFGEVTIVKRAWAKRMTARALIDTSAIDVVANRIAAVRARPSLWIGQEGIDSLSIYGFFKDFSIEVGETVSKLALSIEGMSQASKIEPIIGKVDWPNVGDPDGTKPKDNADETGKNTSKDTAAVGGKPATEVLSDLRRIEPIERDTSALKQVQIAHNEALELLDQARVEVQAAQRQAERDAGRVDQSVLASLLENARTRQILRDAGFIIDQASGIVRLYALDQVADRQSRAEVTLEGQKALITQKADATWVREQIALAVLNPEQVAELEDIIARLTMAEQTIDGLNAAIALKAEAIELTRLGGRVTTVGQQLDALKGTVETKAERTVVNQLVADVGSAVERLEALGDTSRYTISVRQAQGVADDGLRASLDAKLLGDQAHRYQITQAAEARTEMYARVVDGERVTARAQQVLAAENASTRAMVIAESEASVQRDAVIARDVRSLGVVTEGQAAAIGDLRSASITAAGGIAETQTTIRQVAGQVRDTDASALLALVDGDKEGRKRLDQVTQIQTQLTTTIIANEAASAVARQSLLTRMGSAEAAILDTLRALSDTRQALVERVQVIEAAFGNAETGLAATRARVLREEQARAEGDRVNAEALALISAELNNPTTGLPWARAAIADLGRVMIDGDKANAEAIRQVRAVLDGVGDVGIQQAFEAIVTRLGKVEGRWSIVIDANGNLSGIQLIGSNLGPASFNLINTDLKMGTGRVILNTGKVMLVLGLGFGREKDMVLWFGPTPEGANVDLCARSNATMYLATSGDAYFGGSLTAGFFSNPGGSSSLAADAVAEIPYFSSNGRPIRYVASWSYRSTSERVYPPTAEGRDAYERDVAAYNATGDQFQAYGTKTVEQPRSTITLSRTFDGTSYTQIQQQAFTTQRLTFRGIAPTVGDAPGRGTFTTDIGGGFTVLDPVQSTANRAVRFVLARGFNMGVDGVVQNLTIKSIEE